jgi:hypothetical protein
MPLTDGRINVWLDRPSKKTIPVSDHRIDSNSYRYESLGEPHDPNTMSNRSDK